MSKLAQVMRKAASSPNLPYCPEAGDIIDIEFDPQAGREQAGKRPALVLSSKLYNERARLCVLCPITSQSKQYPFEVAVANASKTDGFVLSDQVKSLSWEARKASFREVAPKPVIDEVRAKVKALVGI
jgi:mRNA interferase MazF